MYSPEEQRQFFDLSKRLLQSDGAAKAEDLSQPAQLLRAGGLARDLQDVIIYHEWRYYILNDPVISDYEYDQLYKKLENLEARHPELISPDSPTQRVSNELSEDLPQVMHLVPMLSLANSYDPQDLIDFDTQIKKLTLLPENANVEYCVEPKFDGGSIALVYENDRLVRGATRGNGVFGEEMTNNAKAIRTIPLRAEFSKYNIQKAEVRGEVLIRKDVFKKMNELRQEQGLPLFANPRNTASGGLRMKDPKEVAGRGLVAFLYTLSYGADENNNDLLQSFETHDESLNLLASLGFNVPIKEKKVCKNINEVIDYSLEWQMKREDFPYEIDGMVVKVNSLELQEKCGFTNHHPRWAIAFKFKAKQATTKLLNVEYQVGKIGSITPVAKLEPVQLAGVTVSSVSLHNEDFITSKDIRIGDTVLVERAGDVIPYIVKPMEDLRDGTEKPIKFPENCPSCNTKLVRAENEAAWRCLNASCEAQVLQRMIFHVSKDAMDIDGLGKAQIERFYQLGWLKSLADIYRLEYDKIAELEGFGEKSAANLKSAVDNARQNPIHRLLHSLSIHHLGKKASKLLAAEINHVLDLQHFTLERLTDIKDVGPVVAENVIEFFQNPQNIELLREMENLGVNMQQTDDDKPRVAAADAPLIGKTILFTGTLQKMGRKEAQSLAEKAGAKNISAVSSNLNILVVGENAGSKLKKAQALGTVEIISEEEFIALVK